MFQRTCDVLFAKKFSIQYDFSMVPKECCKGEVNYFNDKSATKI